MPQCPATVHVPTMSPPQPSGVGEQTGSIGSSSRACATSSQPTGVIPTQKPGSTSPTSGNPMNPPLSSDEELSGSTTPVVSSGCMPVLLVPGSVEVVDDVVVTMDPSPVVPASVSATGSVSAVQEASAS